MSYTENALVKSFFISEDDEADGDYQCGCTECHCTQMVAHEDNTCYDCEHNDHCS